MARFLFTVWPFAGHLHPCIAVGHALVKRGHRVAFCTGASVKSLLEGEGFEIFPFEEVDELKITDLVSSEFPYAPSLWARLRTAPAQAVKFREWLVDTIPQQVEDVQRAIAKWSPDVLISDVAFWGPILILHEKLQIPVAAMSILAACVLPGPDSPCWGQGWPRPRSAMMRFCSEVCRTLGRWLSRGFLAEVNVVRGRYGLGPLQTAVTEFAGRLPLYIVPSIREYDYNRRDLPPTVQYVGPVLWDNPGRVPTPEWLSELPSDRPLIYATEATIGTGEPFLLKATAAACANLPVRVVMTTGKQRSPAEFGLTDVPPNVRVERYVPQSVLLPKTAVMVTVGGSGGVLAALKAGVPLVIVPTEWDRPENAQRVLEAGAGLRIAPGKCTKECLRAAIERVLNEPSFRKNAQRLAEACTRYGGAAEAAQLLEKFNSTSKNASSRGVALGA